MDGSHPAVRISPAERPVLGTIVATVAGRVTRTEPHRVFTTIARHRALLRAWLPFAGLLLLRGRLPRADSELVIARTAWNCTSWYEWVQHAGMAVDKGLPVALVEAVPGWERCNVWTDRQRTLLRAADELHGRSSITDDTWAALTTHLTDVQLIELCFVVGHYEMLAMALNALGVEPEPAALAAIGGRRAEIADQLRDALAAQR
jgi:alkylhydroperoxidase family enzyme